MQTFLPYEDFRDSISCLDKKRKWKQCVEAKQIINALFGLSKGWVNHPAVKMWKGYENTLIEYYNIALAESIAIGIKNKKLQYLPRPNFITKPHWLGRKDFHDSHKSNLLRKDEAFYSKYGWVVSSDLPYVWPV